MAASARKIIVFHAGTSADVRISSNIEPTTPTQIFNLACSIVNPETFPELKCWIEDCSSDTYDSPFLSNYTKYDTALTILDKLKHTLLENSPTLKIAIDDKINKFTEKKRYLKEAEIRLRLGKLETNRDIKFYFRYEVEIDLSYSKIKRMQNRQKSLDTKLVPEYRKKIRELERERLMLIEQIEDYRIIWGAEIAELQREAKLESEINHRPTPDFAEMADNCIKVPLYFAESDACSILTKAYNHFSDEKYQPPSTRELDDLVFQAKYIFDKACYLAQGKRWEVFQILSIVNLCNLALELDALSKNFPSKKTPSLSQKSKRINRSTLGAFSMFVNQSLEAVIPSHFFQFEERVNALLNKLQACLKKVKSRDITVSVLFKMKLDMLALLPPKPSECENITKRISSFL